MAAIKTTFWETDTVGHVEFGWIKDAGPDRCPTHGSCHEFRHDVGLMTKDEYDKLDLDVLKLQFPVGKCACGFEFKETESFSGFLPRWRNVNTGEVCDHKDLPIGASWFAVWYTEGRVFEQDDNTWIGPDGQCFVVLCPGRNEWLVDSRASNCTRPEDKKHKCWVRHGEPRQCNVTVDKNGDTCKAGAGSIVVPGWHGYLRNGELVE